MNSLVGRLGTGLVLTLVASFTLLGLAMDRVLRDTAEGYIATRLEHDAESLLAALRWQDGAPALQAAIHTIYDRPLSGHYYTIRAGDALLRSRSLWDHLPRWPGAGVGEQRLVHAAGPGGQPLLLRVAGYRLGGREVVIAVAEDLSALEADLAGNRLRLAAAGGALLLLLVGVQLFLLRRGLAPLAGLQAQADEVAEGARERLTGPVPAEVAPLVEAFNRLLALLSRRLRRARDAAGDLGHELKRPLAVLRQLLDEAGPRLPADARQRMGQQLDRIQVLVERMLVRARLAGEGPPAAAFHAGRDLDALLDSLRRIHAGRDLRFDVTAPRGRLPVDREDMLELLGNLLDNACKWARGRVALHLEAAGEGLRIRVEDDGPGIQGADGDAAARLGRRGSRLDETAPGHGLGLAIVDTIVDQYGGRWRTGRSPLGGARIEVELPLGNPGGDQGPPASP